MVSDVPLRTGSVINAYQTERPESALCSAIAWSTGCLVMMALVVKRNILVPMNLLGPVCFNQLKSGDGCSCMWISNVKTIPVKSVSSL